MTTLTAPWKPCYCSAYSFPHRIGGAQCSASVGQMLCTECGKAGDGVWRDVGEGQTEFWGTLAHDNRRVLVSECCEAEMRFNEPSKE